MKLIYLFIFVLFACEIETGTPESQVQDFIEARVSHVVSREFVLSRTTGKLKEIIENMSDEDFTKFSDLRQHQKSSFKIHSKSCKEKKCFVTYSLGYKTISNDKPTSMTEVKKIAELEFIEGQWLINDVSNIKSYIESYEAIDALKE